MDLRFTLRALTDLDGIHQYIARADRDTADRFVMELREALDVLTLFPDSGNTREELPEGVRVFVYGNYVALYRVVEDAVIIEGVLQGSRDLDRLFGG